MTKDLHIKVERKEKYRFKFSLIKGQKSNEQI